MRKTVGTGTITPDFFFEKLDEEAIHPNVEL